MGRVDAGDLTAAIEWARGLRQGNLVEEFSVGPTTLEDVYVSLVGSSDAVETAGGKAAHV
jgi:hypothetical protein